MLSSSVEQRATAHQTLQGRMYHVYATFSFGEVLVYRRIYSRKICFTATRKRVRKTIFESFFLTHRKT